MSNIDENIKFEVRDSVLIPGPQGEPGEDGYSPEVTISSITGGHRVTITDKNHQSGQNFDVLDGADGSPGQTGATGPAGADGFSPEVTISSITGGHRVTITDEDHQSGQSFDVLDGADGDDYVLTAQDKSDIADLVLADLPTWTGGEY